MDDIETLEPEHLPGAAGRITRTSDGPVPLVVKRASGGDRAALRREAEVLRAVGGSELVQIVELRDGPERTELVVRDTGGPSLAAALADPATDSATALQLMAAACDAVGRLHARGWAHGRIETDHVLLTTRGRMRLCSLSAAKAVDVEPDVARADRVALLRMVDDWTQAPAGPGRDARLGARLRAELLGRRTHRLPDDPDPKVLARILRRTGRSHSVPLRAGAWLAPLALAAVGVWVLVGAFPDPPAATGPASTDPAASTSVPPTTTSSTSSSSTTSSSTTSTAPPPTTFPLALGATSADAAGASGRADQVRIEGNAVVVGDRRYRVGEPGDLVAVGDWDCDGTATVAVLRPTTGAVHVFDRWAADGEPATARQLGSVEDAAMIEADPTGCGPPWVTTRSGAAHPISTAEGQP